MIPMYAHTIDAQCFKKKDIFVKRRTMRTPPPNLLNFDYFLPAADSGMTGMGFLSSIVGLYANQLSSYMQRTIHFSALILPCRFSISRLPMSKITVSASALSQ
jgi:hypothetical protein